MCFHRSMHPGIKFGDGHFRHSEPVEGPYKIMAPWFFDGTPGKPVLFSRGSKAVANMCLLVGCLVVAAGPQLVREQAQQGFLDRE